MRYLNSYVQQITLLIFLICGSFSAVTMAQRVAVRTNLLEWATISPNIGAEFAIAPHWSIDFGISGNCGNPTSYKIDNVKVQPELRYWFGRPMARHFLGLTAFYSSYDACFKNKKRYGDAGAAGITYGYDFVLGKRWNLEATVGIGVLRYRQFGYAVEDPKPGNINERGWVLAPVKLGVTISYIIK